MISTGILISIQDQTLVLLKAGKRMKEYAIATAANGPGELNGSECTPRGRHVIRAKIGARCPTNTVFAGRRPSGEIFTEVLRNRFPSRDWILTRILWLSGMEPGHNRLGNRDTMRRYIYIHGCPDQDEMRVPNSHGCIKMHNADMIELFDEVLVGTQVEILEGSID